MTATIKLPFDIPATLGDDGVWQCEDEQLLQLLRRTFPLWERSGADPNPPRTAAEFAVELLGGKVVHVDTPEFDPDVVY